MTDKELLDLGIHAAEAHGHLLEIGYNHGFEAALKPVKKPSPPGGKNENNT